MLKPKCQKIDIIAGQFFCCKISWCSTFLNTNSETLDSIELQLKVNEKWPWWAKSFKTWVDIETLYRDT